MLRTRKKEHCSKIDDGDGCPELERSLLKTVQIVQLIKSHAGG